MIYTRTLGTAQVAEWVLEETQQADCFTAALEAVAEELKVDPADLWVDLKKYWDHEAHLKHHEY